MGMKRKLRRRLSRAEGRLRREGRRLASVLLCGALIVGNLSAVPVSVLADDDNDYTYEIEKTALQEALQTAVSEGNTVSEDLEFAGEHAEEYAELFEADGTLYELELPDEEIDEDDDRDKALDLRIFARIEGDIPVDEAYEIDGSEEIVFLLSNKTEETVTATICVDDLETEAITVLPAASIPVEEESVEIETIEVSAAAVSRGISAGGSGSGGSGGPGASASEKTAETEATEEAPAIEITDAADNAEAESASIREDTDVTIVSGGDESESGLSADGTDADTSGPEEEGNISVDPEKTDDEAEDAEAGDTGIDDHKTTDTHTEDANTEDIDIEKTNTENTDTEKTDAGNTDTENTDTENTDTENTDTENTDTENTDTENTDTENTDTNKDTVDTGSENTGSEEAGDHTGDGKEKDMGSENGHADTAADSSDDSTGSTDDRDANDADASENADTESGQDASGSGSNSSKDNTSDGTSGSDITEDSEVSVLGSAISIHSGVLLAAGKATDSDADETASPSDASPSDADKIIEGELYEAVRFEKYGAAAFVTTACDLQIDGNGIVDEVKTITYSGEDYIVEVSYGVEAGLPDDVELIAVEYEKDSEAYLTRYEEAAILYGWTEDRTDQVRIFNIGFYVDGEEIQPSSEVQVVISYLYEEEAKNYTVTHFGENGTETIETDSNYNEGTQSVAFGVESFSDILLIEDSYTIKIENHIAGDGTFVAVVMNNGVEINEDDYTELTITWYKSSDGSNYTVVTDENVLKGNTINVAKDQGALCYYYAVVTDSDGNTMGTVDNAVQVPYADELLNGSFEDPSTNGSSLQLDQSQVDYWNTTASDGKIEIGKYSANWNVYGSNNNAESGAGEQFAELNAASAGALYQDVLTAGGLELYWSLLHRARNANGGNDVYPTATDSMYVVIMSTEDAEKLLAGVSESNQQSVLTAMITSILGNKEEGEGEYTLVNGTYANENVTATIWKITTTSTVTYDKYNGYTDSGWEYYSGSYIVPEDQYLTRFFFVAGDTSTGDATVGNLLDDVKFSQNISYTIEYWVWDSESETYVLQSDDTEEGDITPYTNVSASYMDNYSSLAFVGSIEGTTSGGDNPDERDFVMSTGMKVEPESTYLSLYFKPSGISVVKIVDGVSDEDLTTIYASDNQYKARVSLVNGTTNEDIEISVDATGSGSMYKDLTKGTYKISETDYPKALLDGKYSWVSMVISVGDSEITSDNGVYEFILNDSQASTTITFTNTYQKSADIMIVKTDANTGETLSSAMFKLIDSNGKYYQYNSSEGKWEEGTGEVSTDEAGEASYSNLLDGSYTLQETSAPSGYNMLTDNITFDISNGSISNMKYGDTDISENTSPVSVDTTDGITFTIKNTSGSALPETGGPGTTPFRLVGLLLTSCSAYLIYETLRRRRNCLSR